MPRRFPLMLGRIVRRVARLSPPRHRELVRGMLAELDSIADPVERTRFALGAIAAIARLTLTGYGRSRVNAPGRLMSVGDSEDGPSLGGLSMSRLPTRQLLGRHAAPFAVSISLLTVLMLARHAVRWVPQLSARGAPVGASIEAVLLAVPFTLALTIPMAVFLAVSWAFMRLGKEGAIATARRERHGIRGLVTPVLGAAAIISALTFVSNAELVPRANARLVAVIQGAAVEPTDRTMTMGELREAGRRARAETGADAAAHVAAYEVEVQKKFALAAACVLLALVGAATAIRFPRGGIGLVLGASTLVFLGYYLVLVMGETLADRQVLSPLVGIWSANAILLAVALILTWRRGRPGPTHGAETLALNR